MATAKNWLGPHTLGVQTKKMTLLTHRPHEGANLDQTAASYNFNDT